MNTHFEQLLRPSEVAELMGVGIQTLASWRCNKRYGLNYVKLGRCIRYRGEDVETFIKNRTVTLHKE